jgi:hypothetical protein
MCQQSDAPSFIVHHTPVSLSSTSKNMMWTNWSQSIPALDLAVDIC